MYSILESCNLERWHERWNVLIICLSFEHFDFLEEKNGILFIEYFYQK